MKGLRQFSNDRWTEHESRKKIQCDTNSTQKQGWLALSIKLYKCSNFEAFYYNNHGNRQALLCYHSLLYILKV